MQNEGLPGGVKSEVEPSAMSATIWKSGPVLKTYIRKPFHFLAKLPGWDGGIIYTDSLPEWRQTSFVLKYVLYYTF